MVRLEDYSPYCKTLIDIICVKKVLEYIKPGVFIGI